MKELEINLTHTSYRIIIEDGLFDHIGDYIKQIYKNNKVFIVTDDNVAKLYLKKVTTVLEKDFTVESVVIPHGEASKCLTEYSHICEELLKKDIRRNHLLLALGGGVIGDLTGFVASTLYRGIPYIGIPTSLLSQMDSSIGGKTGIDFFGRKNILGAFKQPSMVLIDPKVLNTLEPSEYISGMGELIKHGAIGNKKLFDLLDTRPGVDEEIIKESLSVKKKVVEIDEFDTGERMKLNFGHTFGHAIELKYGYKHGVAVGIGMRMALTMGVDLGVTDPLAKDTINRILDKYGFPQVEYDYKEYLADVVYDKKNIAGTINFIFITKLGEAVIYPIREDDLKEKENECNN
ncbi:3-dehydroquinate synthase [Anaeroplasma bactoclasticum]|jgi:3-dehydroquinate synthase|uniref:3-dehydroquinate synthase n=1 Tax=Anaeroplasma bactoclasticum TaxID=2088 RepID=A0A397RTZ2_9MOLU|nr:3-dehydroquinate synthase [Anaeroplasma bactoclasticum]RIA75585.1 3-dehydroquinate synthase [Anaeroplasma bactoclasticum]